MSEEQLWAALDLAKRTLRRLASPDEVSGSGETETMTGPAAVEMRARMKAFGL